MKNTFEKQLPEGYIEKKHINAKDKKTGIVPNLVALAVMVLTVAVAVLTIVVNEARFGQGVEEPIRLSSGLLFIACLAAYIVLHELVHGAVYKIFTGEKLTYGISFSCAFCGLPDVYTYRRTALAALLAPFAVFTLLLLPICIWLYFVHPYYYMMSALFLGIHIGGCSGDIYMTYILLFKYSSSDTLIRDTGPEQFIYQRNTESEE